MLPIYLPINLSSLFMFTVGMAFRLPSTYIFQARLHGNVCLHGLKKYVVLFSQRLKKCLAEQGNREKKNNKIKKTKKKKKKKT